MTKKQFTMYGIALALILTGILVAEGLPLMAVGMIGGSGLCVRAAERG